VHVAPACAGFGKGSDNFGSYVRSLALYFRKRLFPGLEPMTSWSQDNKNLIKIVEDFSTSHTNIFISYEEFKKLILYQFLRCEEKKVD
jgi:hypothetical protein